MKIASQGCYATSLGTFVSDLRSVLGLRALGRVGRKVLDDDCPGLAGQLAYFTLFSLFPFLLFLVALAGLVIDHPESVLRTLTERMQGWVQPMSATASASVAAGVL